MATPPATAAPFQQDVTKLTKPQKLAALLVILGSDGAAQILRGVEEHEVEAISIELAKIDLVSQRLQHDILKEFSSVAVEAAASLRGGVDFTQSTLEKALGLFKAAHIVGRVAPSRRHARGCGRSCAPEPQSAQAGATPDRGDDPRLPADREGGSGPLFASLGYACPSGRTTRNPGADSHRGRRKSGRGDQSQDGR